MCVALIYSIQQLANVSKLTTALTLRRDSELFTANAYGLQPATAYSAGVAHLASERRPSCRRLSSPGASACGRSGHSQLHKLENVPR
eukprot:963129-Pleurochrysis_carterae.AAC.1